MSFFSQVIVPRLCDFLLNKSLLARHRRKLLAGAYGDVVEIGFGTGLNLPYYPERVHKLTAVDPNPGMHRLAQKNGCPSRTVASIAPSARLRFALSGMSLRRCGKCTGC